MAWSGPHSADRPTVLPGSHSMLPCLPMCTTASAPNPPRAVSRASQW